jgi:hypothetical protein
LRLLLPAALSVLFFSACEPMAGELGDSGVPLPVLDAGTPIDDAGSVFDAGHPPVDAGFDAGPMDAGARDAGTDAGEVPYYSTNPAEFYGAPRCPGLVLCEDFENPADGGRPNPSIWSLRTTPGVTVAVDTTRAARGGKSLRITTPNSPSEAYIRESLTYATTGNAFYGRLFYFQKAPGPQNFVHWNIIEATGPQTVNGVNMQAFYRYGGVSLGGIFNNYLFQFEHRPRESGYMEIGQQETNQIEPLGAWVCLEWFFDGNATEGRLWRNGVELPALHATSPYKGVSFKMPTFDGLNIGWALYQSPEVGYEVWIDEVAVDTRRIGCNR